MCSYRRIHFGRFYSTTFQWSVLINCLPKKNKQPSHHISVTNCWRLQQLHHHKPQQTSCPSLFFSLAIFPEAQSREFSATRWRFIAARDISFTTIKISQSRPLRSHIAFLYHTFLSRYSLTAEDNAPSN